MGAFKRYSEKEIQQRLEAFRGRSAGIVYSFEPETAVQKIWYDRWHSDVIFFYGQCIEIAGLHPYFIDVTSFCRQALTNELPGLVCAFNLNAGITPIAHWTVMPSVSLWAGIEPMPARADVLIVGERKDTANLIARDAGLQIPRTFAVSELNSLPSDLLLMKKPRDLGGSVGIVTFTPKNPPDLGSNVPFLIQQFVLGYDLTVPVLYSPTAGMHIAPVGTLYVPDDTTDTTWFHDEKSKLARRGYTKRIVSLPTDVQSILIAVAERMELGAYARFDLRISREGDLDNIQPDDLWFLEVNPLPTLRAGINLINAITSEPFMDAVRGDLSAMGSYCSRPADQVIEAFPIIAALLSLPA
jgi:hypothetical protein